MRPFPVVTALIVAMLVGPDASAQTIDGTWIGVADVRPAAGLPVGVRMSLRQAGDSVRVEFTLPESRLVSLRIPSPYSDSTGATYRNGVLRLEFTPDIGLGLIGGLGPRENERIGFEGRVTGDELRGRLWITSYSSTIVLRRALAPEHAELAITFTNPNDSLRLGGMVLRPAGVARPPVVVWVTGSDPDDRYAWHYDAMALARAGVASLLYDKRGVGESAGASHDLASWDDLAGDLSGAINYLAAHADLVDTSRIGVIGQSQGTWIIAKVAATDPRVKLMVSIAGSGISAAQQETYRTRALMRAAGFAEAEIDRAVEFQRNKFAVARTGFGWEALDSTMQKLRADSTRWFPGYGTGAASRSLVVLRLYGVLQFNYDPTRDLERIRIPTLVVLGQNDRVFPPDVVVQRMERALSRNGNRCVTSHIIPESGHALTMLQSHGDRAFRRVINQEFLRILTEWIPRAWRCQ